MDSFNVDTLDDCENACGLNDLCFTYTYKAPSCLLKFRYKYPYTAINDEQSVSGYPVIGLFDFFNYAIKNEKKF